MTWTSTHRDTVEISGPLVKTLRYRVQVQCRIQHLGSNRRTDYFFKKESIFDSLTKDTNIFLVPLQSTHTSKKTKSHFRRECRDKESSGQKRMRSSSLPYPPVMYPKLHLTTGSMKPQNDTIKPQTTIFSLQRRSQRLTTALSLVRRGLMSSRQHGES